MSRTQTRPQPARRRSSPKRTAWRWAGFVAIPLALAALIVVDSLAGPQQGGPEQAIPFELATTDGLTVALDEALAQGDALLYFSMGVGCDGCFAQIPEIESAVAERGMTLLPIMVDPVEMVAVEADRFGIDTPILIDSDTQISQAYEMVGVYGHADRPSHSFALVHQNGTIGWVRHYAEMFVPSDALFAEMDSALGA